jgi:Chlorophyll A-B binding protein
MKSVILASLFASAAAFAPVSQHGGITTSLSAAIDDMPGSINFAAKPFKFDPLNLADTYEPLLPWFKESEIRHGRTAMLAVVGFIATDFVRIPGDMYSFSAIPKTVDAHDALLKSGPMYQLLLWIGLWEIVVTAPACVAMMKGEREPGGTYFFPHI